MHSRETIAIGALLLPLTLAYCAPTDPLEQNRTTGTISPAPVTMIPNLPPNLAGTTYHKELAKRSYKLGIPALAELSDIVVIGAAQSIATNTNTVNDTEYHAIFAIQDIWKGNPTSQLEVRWTDTTAINVPIDIASSYLLFLRTDLVGKGVWRLPDPAAFQISNGKFQYYSDSVAQSDAKALLGSGGGAK